MRNFTDAPSMGMDGGSGGDDDSGSNSSSSNGSDDDDSGQDDDDSSSTLSREDMIFSILDMVRQIGRPDEWLEYGGDVSSVSELNGNLIARTTPENHGEIRKLLAMLRETRALQIHIETRFLLVDQNFLEEVGLDVDMQVGTDDPDDTWSPLKIAQDTFSVAGRQSTGLTGTFGDPLGNAGLTDFVVGTVGGSGRSLDMGFSYLDDLQVSVLIRASQNARRSVALTAPRLTFFNGTAAWISVSTDTSYVSDLTPVPDAVGLDPTVDVASAGVTLAVEGTVSADRRYVTLTLQPQLSRLINIRQTQFTQVVVTDDDDDNVQTVSGSIGTPEMEQTEVATIVSVPDRGTLMLGGQRLIGEIEIEAGVPVLSKIPYLNRLFTNRSKTKDERTLLILVKPTIIIQTEEEELNFPGLAQDPASYNIGNRNR